LLSALSGICIGLLSFSKSEGLVASLIFIFLAVLYLAISRVNNKDKILNIVFFLSSALIFFIPAIIFYASYAPANITITNALFTQPKPVAIFRLKVIFSFYILEMANPNWQGFMLTLLCGLLLSHIRAFNLKTIIIPLFLLLYGAVITLYYFMNTYFKIDWWLQVSLHRIVFSLVPLIIFWTFHSLWYEKGK